MSFAVPTFRTGGGFSLTQRSPRPRATHDQLPPAPSVGSGRPQFLEQLLERQSHQQQVPKAPPEAAAINPSGGGGSSGGGGDEAGRSAAPTSRLAIPQVGPHNLELQIPERFCGGRKAPSGRNATAPGCQRSPRNLTTRPREACMDVGRAASGSLSPLPPTTSLRSASPFGEYGAGQTLSLHGGGDAEPKRGLQGRSQRSPRLHGQVHSHLPASAASAAHDLRGGSPSPFEVSHVSSAACGATQASLAGGGAGDSGLAGGGGAGGGNAASSGYGDHSKSTTTTMARSSTGPPAVASPANMSCVPFPSMRHAHHLSTINPGAGGPRFPPAAPQARDESAISRVSNYSIRPCIHDAQLSARFGAKAACRAPASAGGGGGGQGHPSMGGGGVGGGLGAASRGGSGTVSAAGSDAGERPFDAGVEGSTAPTARRENSRGKGSQTKVPKVRVASGGQGA